SSKLNNKILMKIKINYMKGIRFPFFIFSLEMYNSILCVEIQNHANGKWRLDANNMRREPTTLTLTI
ncbi:MAG: hypothetical protein KAT69_02735, partial [Candidatus Aminicenantes bacterium]|nr:hypothetical protein [Candidatus Aminicenantes bacterium]